MYNFLSETDVLKDVASKLTAAGLPYMLTGSLAMSYYAQPRMTRDIDIVVYVKQEDIDPLEALFNKEYYISKNAIKDAVMNNSMFNIIHNESIIKVDFILRKKDEYRLIEFERRQKVPFSNFEIFIVSKEDLVLSKMIWSKETKSEIQHRDIKNLISTKFDKEYLSKWVHKLGLEKIWTEVNS